MGIGPQALQLTASLWKDGYFKNFKSVIELGSQDFAPNLEVAGNYIERLFGLNQIEQSILVPEKLYKVLGFEKYQCIDADGNHNALVYDLNKNFVQTHGYSEQFDLVTNHGTTEHVFDQLCAFHNVHNLCKKDGIMIHGLPFQGYLNHGFYNYHPSFYYDLAAANNYRVVGLYLNIHDSLGEITPYSDQLMKFLYTPPGTNMLLFAVLEKITDEEFCIPYNGRYIEISLLKGEYSSQKLISQPSIPSQISAPLLPEQSGQTSSELEQLRTQLHQAQTEIIAMKTSKFWKLRAQWFKVKTLMGLPRE